jgi:uncharacterized protein YndB with AHSA1/START domain
LAAHLGGNHVHVSRNRREIAATPNQVWSVLADGWLYPSWVVGATRMRDVDRHWPAPGARLHHSVGAWPLMIDDETQVEESVPESLLRLRARAWPAGAARVALRLTPNGSGTLVEIEEDAVSRPGRLVPAPLRHLSLAWRNTETLRRLARIAENGGRG